MSTDITGRVHADGARTTLALADIATDAFAPARAGALDEATIQRYAAAFDELPPVTVYRADGRLLLADGHHRLATARRLGRETIEAEVHDGTMQDAEAHALVANTRHGLPLTGEERDGCIRRLCQVQPELSQRQIARAMGVSHTTVQNAMKTAAIRGALAEHGKILPPEAQLRHLADAPQELWLPLAAAVERRGWTAEQTAHAVANVMDEQLSAPYRAGVLAGRYDPVSAPGERAVRPRTRLEQVQLRTEINAAKRAGTKHLWDVVEALAFVRTYEPADIAAAVRYGRDRSKIIPSEAQILLDALTPGIAFLTGVRDRIRDQAQKHAERVEKMRRERPQRRAATQNLKLLKLKAKYARLGGAADGAEHER